jgi:hypothetical protein
MFASPPKPPPVEKSPRLDKITVILFWSAHNFLLKICSLSATHLRSLLNSITVILSISIVSKKGEANGYRIILIIIFNRPIYFN